MKLRSKIIAMLLVSMCAIGGCGNSEGSEKTVEPVSVTTEMAEEYATLGDYNGLSLVKYITEVTEEDVNYAKEMFMEDYRVEMEISDRGVEMGDYISGNFKEKMEGQDELDYDTIDIQVGQEEICAELDEALVGHKVGDTVKVDTVYLDEEGTETKTTYTVKIENIYQVSYPEYNDEFVKENTEYTTVAELDATFKNQVQDENDMYSMDNLRETALAEVVAISTFKELPKDLLEDSYNEMKASYESYAEMFGMELSDMVSEEELNSAAELNLQEKLVIQSLIKAENIEKTEENYDEFIKQQIAYMDVETEEELMDFYTEQELEYTFYKQLALDAVIAKATVTEEIEVIEEEITEDEMVEEE